MDTPSRTASPALDVDISPQSPAPIQDKISAYYSLVFPHITFYIQTLSVTIGRRCAPNSNVPTSSTSERVQVDVDLGALKSVSRLHAKIEYDQDEDSFVLVVLGRNGAWVDGVWCGAGTRTALSERSHIQIASRTFTFVLPPPPPPQDTPSPSSQSSVHRARSPSVDITSISPPSSQPSHSPPLRKPELCPLSPESQIEILPDPEHVEQLSLPNSNSIGKGKGTNPKKRKKNDVDLSVLERPEVMPPKPPFTYAQLIYRSIRAIDGKATLQEICNWIMTTYDYYKYADSAWMSSVRHNLSSGRAFLKMERCGGDRGKGFFWSIDEKYAQSFEEQEAKALQNATAARAIGDGYARPGRRKDKNMPLEPPLKRSVKGDSKGPLPPPLTSVPLVPKPVTVNVLKAALHGPSPYSHTTPATGTLTYKCQTQGSSSTCTNPYAALAKHWGPAALLAQPAVTASAPSASSTPLSGTSSDRPTLNPSHISILPSPSNGQPVPQNAVPDVVIPIILGAIPSTHPDYEAGQPNNSRKAGYMILHERKLILDPDVFSGLTEEMLWELEKMGAMAAVKVLTGHMVRALKERRAKNKNKEKSVKKAVKAAKKAAALGSVSTPAESKSEATKLGCNQVATAELKHAHCVPPDVPDLVSVSTEKDDGDGMLADPGTPIVNIDDSGDEGPMVKRRKLDHEVT